MCYKIQKLYWGGVALLISPIVEVPSTDNFTVDKKENLAE